MSKHAVRFDDMEGDTFVGTVKKAYYEEDEDFNGKMCEFAIIKLETDFSDEWTVRMKYSESKRSLFGRFIKSMEKNAGVRIPPGKDIDALIGTTFKFERTDIEFGKDIKVEAFPLPVEVVEEEKPKKKGKGKSKAKPKKEEAEEEETQDSDDDDWDDDEEDA